MTNTDIKKFATELAEILTVIEDQKLEAKALLEAADKAGVNPKALAKVAKEMLKDSDKLRKQYEEEEQLNLFRDAVDIYSRKGLTKEFA